MRIKSIDIKNFRSYYGDNNHFEFSDGLTLILGDNGDGKTTFFEALEWLFDTTLERANISNVSEMRKSKLEIGERDDVYVAMTFDHNGEKIVEKSFSITKTGPETYSVSNASYHGYETNGIERESVDGKLLITRCYDSFIRRFSMFKGESDLSVFDNAASLKTLVDKFSDIHKFDGLVANTESFEQKANKALLQEMKSDDKISKETKSFELQMTRLSGEIRQNREDIKDKEDVIATFSSNLNKLEQNQETSEKYRDIQERLKAKNSKRTQLLATIKRKDYNHCLLDQYWVLAPFGDILTEFKQKCASLSKERRTQEKNFDKQQAAAKAKLETIKEIQGALANGATELPWYLPNQETMEDMINDHICKVCGREAPDGSEAYNFMVHRLEEYRAHVEAKCKRDAAIKSIDGESLFKNDYITELHSLSISLSGPEESKIFGISREISDWLNLVAVRKNELKGVEEEIQDLQDEKARILIQAGNVSESLLESQFNDIKGWYEQKERASVRLSQLEEELKNNILKMDELKEQMNNLNPANSQVKVLKKVHKVLEEISKAFSRAQKDNLRRFLTELEKRANDYLDKLSANDFHGNVRLVQTANDSTEIHLYSSNGTEIVNPSGSQQTVMYISVLFAISDFTQEKRDEDYPLFFDAATSSFGDSKESEFYNVIDKIDKQCIIVIKDFITRGKVREEDVNKLTCSVYRINKADSFDKTNMATIRTIINKIK